MYVPGRHEASASYRYGFQGQEKDDEIKGEGNSLNYTFRMHDPRVGRFFAVDPLAPKYPHNSPYAFSENRVIDGVELEGAEFHYYGLQFVFENGKIVQTIVKHTFTEETVKWKLPSWDAVKGKYVAMEVPIEPFGRSYILVIEGYSYIFETASAMFKCAFSGDWEKLTPENHKTLEGIQEKMDNLGEETDFIGALLTFKLAIGDSFKSFFKRKPPITQATSKISVIEDVAEEIPSSLKLGKNLEAKGVIRPNNSAAHHIVAGEDARAAVSRDILKKAGIGINEADNGVFLPQNKNVANPPASTHSTLHTDLYYKNLEERLRNTNDIKMELKKIAKELLDGTFEH